MPVNAAPPIGYFVCSNSGFEIARFADSAFLDPVAHLFPLVRSGCTLSYENLAMPVMVPTKTVELKSTFAQRKRDPKATKTAKQPRSKGSPKWEQGDTVYLNWPSIASHRRTNLTTVRMSKGTVHEFRGGQGIRTTVGVQFGKPPDLLWLSPDDLSPPCSLTRRANQP